MRPLVERIAETNALALQRFLESYLCIWRQESHRSLRMVVYFLLLTVAGNFLETASAALFLSRFSEVSILGLKGVESLPLLWVLSGLVFVPVLSFAREKVHTRFCVAKGPAIDKLVQGTSVFRLIYIVVSGKVLIHIGDKRIAELGGKTCFGEMAVLDAGPRSADASAAEDTELLKLSQKDLLEVMGLNVGVSMGIIKTLSDRLRTALASAQK